MSYYRDSDGCGCITLYLFITYAILPGLAYMIDHDVFTNYIFTYSVAGIAFVVSIIMWQLFLRENNKRHKAEKECEQEKSNCKKEIAKVNEELQRTCNRTNELLKSATPFTFSASLAADMECYIYDKRSSYLRNKPHPAYTSAEVIKEMKEKTKMHLRQYKEMLYKYEFLLDTFPELKIYTDDDEALVSLADCSSLDDFDSSRDHAADYLTTEEWKQLTTDQRNQLALDRYKQRTKSTWVIGIEYEMFVEYTLRQKGFTTIPFGSLKGLEDLGRDIIAKKRNEKTGLNDYYIIQCKNYSVKGDKKIFENVVCQTYGTTMEYMIRHNLPSHRVFPIIVSTVPLSEMAKKFAVKLGVIHWQWEKGDYPMIKCNIGKDGMKIYHLPFDQQYYRTEIKNDGEFYAWTVNEAVKAGFRRAFRHIQS